MTLDTRARQAAEALERSVTNFTPNVSAAGVAKTGSWIQAVNYAAAMAAVVVLIAVGAWLVAATEEPDVADTTLPSVTPTTVADPIETPEIEPPEIEIPVDPIPEPDVPIPIGGGDAEEPEEPAVDEPPVVAPDTEPPLLEITTPQDGQRFDEKVITFAGLTEPGAVVSAGPYQADVDAAGKWSIVLVLSEGGNRATFVAQDEAGNATTATVMVFFDPPAPPPTEPPKKDPPPEEPPPKEEPPAVEFTAHAKFGSCEFDPPYDIYYGTSKPGSKITVTSEFGGGSTTANAEGGWEVQVFFPEAPFGEAFLVTVKDAHGNKKKFEFVSYAG